MVAPERYLESARRLAQRVEQYICLTLLVETHDHECATRGVAPRVDEERLVSIEIGDHPSHAANRLHRVAECAQHIAAERCLWRWNSRRRQNDGVRERLLEAARQLFIHRCGFASVHTCGDPQHDSIRRALGSKNAQARIHASAMNHGGER
jgi:hypothetical protein